MVTRRDLGKIGLAAGLKAGTKVKKVSGLELGPYAVIRVSAI